MPVRGVGAAQLESLATELAEASVMIGLKEDDRETQTPFTVAAAQEGLDAPGGKVRVKRCELV